MTDNVFAPPQAKLDVHEGPEVLWEMTWKEVRKLYLASVNIRALGVLYAIGAVGILAVGTVSLLGRPERATPGYAEGWIGVIVLVGLVELAACVTSYTRPAWGRWLGIVLCILSLVSFPFGTVIGILGLVAYAQGGKLFGPERLLHKDVAIVYKQRKKDKK